MAYVPLPIIEVGVADLRLDLENYRIPTQRDDEAAALKYLFASEDVMGAARLILRDGYFDNEVPIVMASGSDYVVLEGNRRVSALKALHDPSLVPGHDGEVRALLKRYAVEAQHLPTVIRVLVAPDRATAAPHIARLHTGLSKRRWSRDQQATFYYSLLDASTTVDDVKAQYPDVDVVRFVKMAVARRFLSAAQFKDPSLRDYAASDDLRMSAFEYAYRSKEIAAAIGMEFDGEGFLLPKGSSPRQVANELSESQLAALEYLVNGFRAGRLNTRSAAFRRTDDAHSDLVVLLTDPTQAGRPLSTGGTSSGSSAPPGALGSPALAPSRSGATAGQPAAEASSAVRGPNHPDTKHTLDLSGVDFTDASVNLKGRYHELRAINVAQFPAATAMLLRSVLESTIKFHFESTTTPVVGELGAVIGRVSSAYASVKALKDVINTIQSGSAQKPGSVQWFNLVSHSADAVVDAADVRRAWKQVNPLIRHLLRRPAP